MSKNQNCIICGKPVQWGRNGCPVVKKGQESMALLGGGWQHMIHYDCKHPGETRKNPDNGRHETRP